MKAEGYERFEDYFIRRATAGLTREELAAYCPRSYVADLQPGSLKTILVHGDTDITVPVLQPKRLEEALTAQLGSQRVYALYPHGRKHADDRLYTEELLAVIQNQMDLFFAESSRQP